MHDHSRSCLQGMYASLQDFLVKGEMPPAPPEEDIVVPGEEEDAGYEAEIFADEYFVSRRVSHANAFENDEIVETKRDHFANMWKRVWALMRKRKRGDFEEEVEYVQRLNGWFLVLGLSIFCNFVIFFFSHRVHRQDFLSYRFHHIHETSAHDRLNQNHAK
jgi:hypothetical protein